MGNVANETPSELKGQAHRSLQKAQRISCDNLAQRISDDRNIFTEGDGRTMKKTFDAVAMKHEGGL